MIATFSTYLYLARNHALAVAFADYRGGMT